MKMKFIVIPLVAAVLGAVGVAQWAGYPRAKVTAHVLGEDGNPVSSAKISFAFHSQFDAKIPAVVDGLTDGNGNFTAEGYTDGGFGSSIRKEGYYLGAPNIPPFYEEKDNRWLPWDATYTSVLRKIENPIPMYARHMATAIPAMKEACGYDLEEADWVAPWGKGKTPDFFITVTNNQYRSNNDNEANVTISFPNPDDGIQETQLPKEFANSQFKWPRLAPEGGYQPKFEAHRLWVNIPRGQKQDVNTANEDQAYFFRVRSVRQGDKITSALYGKIKGGIAVGPNEGKNGAIGFTYYLNPTPLDRNMEFDLKKDLFKNLSNDDQPRDP